MHLVAKYIPTPTTDEPQRTQAAVEHRSGQVVYFEGYDLANAEAMVDEHYLTLQSCETVDDFVELLWGDYPEEVRDIILPENPTLNDILTAFGGTPEALDE